MPFNLSSKRNNQSFPAWYGPGAVRCCLVRSGVVNSPTERTLSSKVVEIFTAYRYYSLVPSTVNQLGHIECHRTLTIAAKRRKSITL